MHVLSNAWQAEPGARVVLQQWTPTQWLTRTSTAAASISTAKNSSMQQTDRYSSTQQTHTEQYTYGYLPPLFICSMYT